MSIPDPAATVTAEINMTLGPRRLHLKMSTPAGQMRLADLLPIAQQLANTVGQAAVEDVLERGQTISCKKGCGACCRQLVPVSQVEARRMRDVVNELPEP